MSVMSPIWRKYVDFPPMFGPVITTRSEMPGSMRTSLGIKCISSCASRHGCRDSHSMSAPPSVTFGRVYGTGA